MATLLHTINQAALVKSTDNSGNSCNMRVNAAVFDRNAIDATNIVDYIAAVFARRGAESYLGEKVSMAQHMLQAVNVVGTATRASSATIRPSYRNQIYWPGLSRMPHHGC